MSFDETEKNNYQYLILDVDEEVAGVSRDQLTNILHAENVLARRYFYPGCHQMEPYRSLFPDAGLLLPQTERLVRRVLCLPTGTGIAAGQISLVCQLIRFILKNGSKIKILLDSKSTQKFLGEKHG